MVGIWYMKENKRKRLDKNFFIGAVKHLRTSGIEPGNRIYHHFRWKGEEMHFYYLRSVDSPSSEDIQYLIKSPLDPKENDNKVTVSAWTVMVSPRGTRGPHGHRNRVFSGVQRLVDCRKPLDGGTNG